jgi:hypothetical protein
VVHTRVTLYRDWQIASHEDVHVRDSPLSTLYLTGVYI